MKQATQKALVVAFIIYLASAISVPAFARGGHGGGPHGGGFHGRPPGPGPGGRPPGGFHGRPPHGWHHRGPRWHGSYGFYMDLTPVFWRPWYYPPYYGRPYYESPTVIVQQPIQYVNKYDNTSNYWYYCQSPKGYYPYVTQCDASWIKVHPFPPDAQN